MQSPQFQRNKICWNIPFEEKSVDFEYWDSTYECNKCIYCICKELQRREDIIKKYKIPNYLRSKPKCVRNRLRNKKQKKDTLEAKTFQEDDNKENQI
jgi:hypothetical protein